MIRKFSACRENYNELERELIEIVNGFYTIPNTEFDENYKYRFQVLNSDNDDYKSLETSLGIKSSGQKEKIQKKYKN